MMELHEASSKLCYQVTWRGRHAVGASLPRVLVIAIFVALKAAELRVKQGPQRLPSWCELLLCTRSRAGSGHVWVATACLLSGLRRASRRWMDKTGL